MFGMNDEDLFVFLGAVSHDTVLGVEEATLSAGSDVFREIEIQADGSRIKGCLFFCRHGAYFYTEPKAVHYDWQRQLLKFKKLRDAEFSADAKKKSLAVSFTSRSGQQMEFTLFLERDPSALTEALNEYARPDAKTNAGPVAKVPLASASTSES